MRRWAPRLSQRPTAARAGAFARAEVPIGEVRDFAQVFDDPQVRDMGMLVEIEHPGIGTLQQTGIPWHLSRHASRIDRPPPLLGQHRDEVLAGMGCTSDEIAALRDEGIV